MTIWVYRDGMLVEKHLAPRVDGPRISRMEAYESPIDGALITSDRQRERDLARSNSYDPRDLPREKLSRRREVQKAEASASRDTGRQLDFWRER